ncbi:MAG: hypothetical protein JWM89_3620 [Acidimicrobiales bacterium]|nr:hypothetical protein [Acidimicrobiales bacterium]
MTTVLPEVDRERGSVKGLPGEIVDPGPGSLVSRGWNLAAGDLPLPVLALRRSAVDHNIEAMARWCRAQDVALAPHGKTTMVPELFRRQLAAGAWAITVSTPRQAEAAVHAGAERILVANQLVDPVELRRLLAIAGLGHEVYLFVDSLEGIRRLDEAAGIASRSVRVFVELGFAGGRTGVRTQEAFHELLGAVDRANHIELAGVSAFEGIIPALRRRPPPPLDILEPDLGPVRSYLAAVAAAIEEAQRAGHLMDRPIITAGGSSAFDLVVEHLRPLASLLVLRSGCYVTHDHGLYVYLSPFVAGPDEAAPAETLQAALGLWAHVVSTPEPGVAIAAFGRRDGNDDFGMPQALNVVGGDGGRIPVQGWGTDSMWDQHARLKAEPSADPTPLRPGDVLEFGISHPCTAFDKWRTIIEIDDDDTVLAAWETWF